MHQVNCAAQLTTTAGPFTLPVATPKMDVESREVHIRISLQSPPFPWFCRPNEVIHVPLIPVSLIAPSGDAPAAVGAQEVPVAASGSGNTSTRGSPMSQSIDDFTHVPPARMLSSVTKSQYSQVVFHDVCDMYPTDSDIKCRYTLTSDVSAQPGDKVAVFKVGWSSVSEYLTFERAPQPNEDGSSLSITFKDI
ncbi:hypothetical protein GE061_002802 [Apolygus lucorum]|uniref:SKICH domain-containing protein n=1 Tax=Apolygus lucorum TaxID=248454 RepID=A0A8S9X7Z7_APOLU|nr:hypothetical protein GE061_002802 [Apolygus lucorum]